MTNKSIRILILCEGLEEELYIRKLLSFHGIFSNAYEFCEPINCKSITKILHKPHRNDRIIKPVGKFAFERGKNHAPVCFIVPAGFRDNLSGILQTHLQLRLRSSPSSRSGGGSGSGRFRRCGVEPRALRPCAGRVDPVAFHDRPESDAELSDALLDPAGGSPGGKAA